MSSSPEIRIISGEEYNHNVSQAILEAIANTLASNAICRVALAGGSTPEGVYKLLANSDSAVDWSKVKLYLGDERFTNLKEKQNETLVRESLLSTDLIPKENFLPINQSASSSEQAAREYETLIKQDCNSVNPVFDLILLGMGEDGHTASLFPGEPVLKNFSDSVASSVAPVEPKERVTFTYPMLLDAKQLFFLIKGEGKAGVVRQIINHTEDAGYPICFFPAAKGQVSFFFDQSAASQLV